jgi:mRNA interferase HigB
MHVISKKALVAFWSKHPTARAPLEAWYRIIDTAGFETFVEVKQSFNAADYVPPYTVFDVGGNNFRLITVIHYNRQKLYIRDVFTHTEYDHWSKQQRKKS